jgi:hypothetical protein
MESEQNSSTLRHYLNLYGSLAGRQPFPDHEVYVRGKLENDPQRYAHYLYPRRNSRPGDPADELGMNVEVNVKTAAADL